MLVENSYFGSKSQILTIFGEIIANLCTGMRFFSFLAEFSFFHSFCNNLLLKECMFFVSIFLFFVSIFIAISNQTGFYLFMSLKRNYFFLFMNCLSFVHNFSLFAFLPISSLCVKKLRI